MNHILRTKILSRYCWQALVLSGLALLVFPDVFTRSVWLGQTWLWLMATPICMLLVIQRHRFVSMWSSALVISPARRRRQTTDAQVRRKGFGNTNLKQTPMRAA